MASGLAWTSPNRPEPGRIRLEPTGAVRSRGLDYRCW